MRKARSNACPTPRMRGSSSSSPRPRWTCSWGEPLPHRTLIATMGFDERHVLPALRLMPYDRLVVVAGPETFRSGGFRRLKGLEPSLRPVPVRAFDLLDSLATVRRTILDSAAKGPVRLSVAGGT